MSCWVVFDSPLALVVTTVLPRKRAVRIEIGDRLAAAAVRIQHRDVGPGLVEAAGAIGIALRVTDSPLALVATTSLSLSVPSALKSETVLVLLPFAFSTSVAVWSTTPSPLMSRATETVLPSALAVVVTLALKVAVAIEIADRSGAAAVSIEHRDVGPGLLEAAGAVGIALRRHRQAVGARRRDGPGFQ